MTEHVRQRHLLERNRVPRAWSVSFPDSLSPDGVRGDRARNMVAEVANGAERVRNDFDSISIYQRPIFNATWDSSTGRWVDLVRQGEEGFTFYPTEEGREVVYRCTPFWYRVEYTEEEGLVFASVTDKPLKGYKLAPMFKNALTYEYRPCFEMSYGADRVAHSRAGLDPIVNTPAALMSIARARGSCARTETMADWFCDYILMLVEFGTRNFQGIMTGVNCVGASIDVEYEEFLAPRGFYCYAPEDITVGMELLMEYGNDADGDEFKAKRVKVLSIGDQETGMGYPVTFDIGDVNSFLDAYDNISFSYYPCKTGTALTRVTGASSGYCKVNGQTPCVWRGKENPWGNVSSLICDVLFDFKGDSMMDVYQLTDPQKLSGTLNNYYTKIETRETCYVSYLTQGYVKKFTYVGEDYRMIPGRVHQRDNNLYCAAFTRVYPKPDEKGIRFLRVGGDNKVTLYPNPASFELLAGEDLSSFGARMIFEEAIG